MANSAAPPDLLDVCALCICLPGFVQGHEHWCIMEIFINSMEIWAPFT